MRMEKCIIIFTCMIGMATSLPNNECITPLIKNGNCIDIQNCPMLLKLLIKTKKKPSDVAYLQNSFCGFEGKSTKVCCPLNITSPPNRPSSVQNPDKQVSVKSICGRTNVTRRRIIGGTKAELGAWPWMAALGFWDIYLKDLGVQWLCGGTLISRSHVLTAAHCFIHVRYKLKTVRLGELDLDPTVEDGARPIDFEVDRIIVHPNYNLHKRTSDIAMLKLKKSVDFNEFIQPICLPTDASINNADMSRSMPFVTGWGTTHPDNRPPLNFKPITSLMEVQIPITRDLDCQKAYSKEKVVIDDRVLCAGYPEGGKDSCRLDSGGPLMWPKGKQYFLMGIVAYGNIICGQPNYPTVYTRVHSFIDWIVNNLIEN